MFVIVRNLCSQRGTGYVTIRHYGSEPTVLHVRGSPGEHQSQPVPTEADHLLCVVFIFGLEKTGMKIGPGASGPEHWGSSPTRDIDISLLHSIQPASGAYPPAYVIGTGDVSGGG